MPCKVDEDLLCPSIQLYVKIVDNAIKVIGPCWEKHNFVRKFE